MSWPWFSKALWMSFGVVTILFSPVNRAAAEEGVWTYKGLRQVIDIALNPKNSRTLYASAASAEGWGVFKSADRGESWREMSEGLDPAQYLSVLAVDPWDTNVVYVKVGEELFRTTNGGLNWSRWSKLPTEWITDLEIDPRDSSVMYTCWGLSIFKSSDSGLSWQEVEGWLLGSINDIALDPQDPGVIYAAADQIYKTADEGWTWKRINEEPFVDYPPFNSIAVDPNNPLVMYAVSSGWVYIRENGKIVFKSDIFKSKDGGRTWVKMTKEGLGSVNIECIAVDPLDSSVVYVGTEEGLFSITQPIAPGVRPSSWGKIKVMKKSHTFR